MSAAPSHVTEASVWERIAKLRVRSLDFLAPGFRRAVEAGLAECATIGSITVELTGGRTTVVELDPIVFETLRLDELQRIYYEQGTTNAATAERSWHFYGLGIDNISKRYEWFGGAAAKAAWPDADDRARVMHAWFRTMGRAFMGHGCSWGGNWYQPDEPHVQWGRCAASPHEAPRIYQAAGGGLAGRQAVWRACGAA